MKKFLALALMMTLGSLALAEVKIDGPQKVADYTFVDLKASGDIDGAGFTWKVFDANRKKITATRIRVKDGSLTFISPPGVYTIELTSYRYDEKTKKVTVDEAEATVTIGDPVPPPPPPPPPDDPLVKALSDAYVSSADLDKATTKPKLVEIYRNAAAPGFLAKQPTWGRLMTVMHDAADAHVGEGKLATVRKAIEIELNKTLPRTQAAAIDDAGRTLAAATFMKIAAALESVKGAKQ